MRGRRRTFIGLLGAALILFVAAVLPLPYYLIVPGSAVDLTSAVSIAGRTAPHDRFFLTDVGLIRASPLRLLLALFPGVSVKRAQAIIPAGISPRAFDASMQTAMSQSQMMAAVVGERAAGFHIALGAPRVVIESIEPVSMAVGRLAIGELFDGRTRLGVVLAMRYPTPALAVPVHYTVGAVGGSSGGLMMALRIYDALRGSVAHEQRRIAGTGTIALDGRVGPIEGAKQKLIAAKRAGARVFFVPRENYADIAAERDVRVIPVGTFGRDADCGRPGCASGCRTLNGRRLHSVCERF